MDADISIATIPVNARDASDFGIMKKNDEGYITSFTEKPKRDMLGDWESDTGEEMKKQGKVIPGINGYLYFQPENVV